jgi:hypothetical protein
VNAPDEAPDGSRGAGLRLRKAGQRNGAPV